ncbi:glycosyltransferase [Chryseobacterium aquaticum]|uniref:glycosyltransferase n=1 Tax=Chryseobacterium aquaticum TaxID=452084 RepID=UPI002FC6AAB9
MKLLRKLLPQPKISYAITVNNETEEISQLLNTLLPLIDKKDEVIVLQDTTQKDQKVAAILDTYEGKIIRIEARLDGDFATFKNNLIGAASKDYLFQIDADEIPHSELIKNLKKYLSSRYKCDVFFVPRINVVTGITDEDLQKWNWKIDENGYINFPDYQQRILKLNHNIFWKNKVHEVLFGFKKIDFLPKNNNSFCLMHRKTIDKQHKQNNFYSQL